MTSTETEFKPFAFDNSEIGLHIKVNAVNAMLPEKFLPHTVRVESTFVHRCGASLLSYYLTHDGGMISLPVVAGDGESDLRQLESWLKRHGYRCTTNELDDGITLYSRDA